MRQSVSLKGKVFTIPNLLSMLRIAMIPLFAWLYCARKNELATAVVLALSGVTDMLDGIIARRFHMVSDLGKILDPVADKLTQGAMLVCLCTRFRMMLIPVLLMLGKEIANGITGLLVISRTGNVYGAQWHGKVTTWMLYIMMIIHVLWFDIPPVVSNGLIGLCVAMMVFSLVLYSVRNFRMVRKAALQGGEQ